MNNLDRQTNVFITQNFNTEISVHTNPDQEQNWILQPNLIKKIARDPKKIGVILIMLMLMGLKGFLL